MVMKQTTMAWLSEIYNLILHPGTRQWEREQLVQAKNTLETQLATKQKAGKHEKESSNSLEDQQTRRVLEKLEASLRPLALRNNLTPNVAEFYQTISQSAPKKAMNEETSKVQPAEVSVEPNETGGKAQEVAIFAGGCFWCMVEPFEDQPGILSVLSGYTGGTVPNPTYDQVLSGTTGHVEAVEIIFDPKIITYQDLLQLYWQVTDPTDAFGQFQDRGNFYRPIIFYTTAEQEVLAQRAKKELAQSGYYQQPIVTEIRKATQFWPAENYHQAFYKKQPKRYQQIKRARKQLMLFYRLKRWTNRGEKRS